MKKSNIYWHSPLDRVPTAMQSILVIYDGSVWPAVYANGNVIRYPEDFTPIKLQHCELWCALPDIPDGSVNYV